MFLTFSWIFQGFVLADLANPIGFSELGSGASDTDKRSDGVPPICARARHALERSQALDSNGALPPGIPPKRIVARSNCVRIRLCPYQKSISTVQMQFCTLINKLR